MKCKNCGNEIKENSNFCTKCGTKINNSDDFMNIKSNESIINTLKLYPYDIIILSLEAIHLAYEANTETRNRSEILTEYWNQYYKKNPSSTFNILTFKITGWLLFALGLSFMLFASIMAMSALSFWQKEKGSTIILLILTFAFTSKVVNHTFDISKSLRRYKGESTKTISTFHHKFIYFYIICTIIAVIGGKPL